ncbi:hypothetical protein [Agromyces larvae]|uniref:Uncharacterized protein n=1 Tax=Agromyces larvae TaxID=2929802 RepID=A0ABY4BWC4_9MICO|nr:hypothetical protein [Agromyces larvae]UOE43521.1 hypothetical protein MTO99_15265 [Agromyces larvae]
MRTVLTCTTCSGSVRPKVATSRRASGPTEFLGVDYPGDEEYIHTLDEYLAR